MPGGTSELGKGETMAIAVDPAPTGGSVDAFLAEEFGDGELDEIAAAGLAIDVALLLHDARAHRRLSQQAAAQRVGLTQQAISKLERPHANVAIATLGRYLSALRYQLDLTLRDATSGAVVGSGTLTPAQRYVLRNAAKDGERDA
jgi:transcriptional regulator with XRE-family HTH domain